MNRRNGGERRPLPSLVTIITVPDSAISALAPVMPIPAAKNASRISSRAVPTWAAMSSPDTSRPNAVDMSVPISCRDKVHGGHDHVARSLVAELDDPLAEIGLHDTETGVLGDMVEPDLLAHH